MQELRRIMFSSEELLTAFRAYERVTPGSLHPGEMLSCTPIDDPNLGSAIKVKVKPSAEHPEGSEIFFRSTDVLQRLILFCIENNVVLPREGRKTFEIFNSCASIVVHLDLEFELASEEAMMHSEDIEALSDKATA